MRKIIFLAALCLPACSAMADRQQDQIDDAAAEAVESSERIAALERKVEQLQTKDDKIVKYVAAVSQYTNTVEKNRRKSDENLLNYIKAVDEARTGAGQ